MEPIEINTIEQNFSLYEYFRDKDDEYTLNIFGNKIYTNTLLSFLQKNSVFKILANTL